MTYLTTSNNVDTNYKSILKFVLDNGFMVKGRTKERYIQSPIPLMHTYNNSDSYPLITLKAIRWKNIVTELLWFLGGNSDVTWLHKYGNHIWDEWVDKWGRAEANYSAQWRSFQTKDNGYIGQVPVDQIKDLIDGLKNNPTSRRHVVTAWNPLTLDDVILPPCHMMFQFVVLEDNKLDLIMIQRSADLFLGVPYNIASYALLQRLVAAEVGMQSNKFHHVMTIPHVYENHIGQCEEILRREAFLSPTLIVNEGISVANMSFRNQALSPECFGRNTGDGKYQAFREVSVKDRIDYRERDELACILMNYNSNPFLKGEVAV